jgi:signal transduction histidine kinase
VRLGEWWGSRAQMTVEPYAYIGAAGIIATLVAYLLWTAPASERRTAAAILSTNLQLWLAGEVLVIVSQSAESADAAVRFTYAALGCLPFTVHRLVATLGDPASRANRWVGRLTAAFAAAGIALMWTNLVVAGAHADAWGYHRISGPLFVPFASALFAGLVLGIGLLGLMARSAPEAADRLRCQHILAGVVLNVVLGVLNLAILQPLGLHRYRMFLVPLGVIVAAYSIIFAISHARLVDIPTALRRSVVYAGLLATLLVPCLGISLLAEQLMTGSIALGPSFVTAALFCVAGFGFPRLRVSAERTLEQALFGARADDRLLLRAASREVTSVLSLTTLAEITRSTLAHAFEARASLWLKRGDVFLAVESGDDVRLAALEAPGAFAFLDAASDPVVVGELDASASAQRTTLRAAGIEVVVPLRVKDRTVGLLTLGPRGDRRLYTDDDLSVVVTLANQVAVALENARLYEELRESREQVSRASRLSAVGTLAAGVAHEIRNPLVAVRTFLQLLPDRLADPEFLGRFRALTLDEVDRIARLTTELLTFARSHERKLRQVDMAVVVDQVVSLMAPEGTKHGVSIVLTSPGELPAVRGDSDQLQQVVLNLVLNAVQASPAGTTVRVLVQQARNARGEDEVRVEVADQGPGVPPENAEAIFAPFFSTKDGSTGLGLAVAHQLIEEHGGRLRLGTPSGQGAVFTVVLPVAREGEGPTVEPAPPEARPRWGHDRLAANG